MTKYTTDFKIGIVKEYLSGVAGVDSLAKKHGLPTGTTLSRWIHAYNTLGEDGLKRSRTNKVYSVDFKLKAITMYENSGKSYQEVADALKLNNPSLIGLWLKNYHERGMEGLSRSKGGPPLSKNKPSSSTKIDDLELANQRIAELEYELKMQTIRNKYLEQLRSLRQEKAMKKKQESSTSSVKKKNIR